MCGGEIADDGGDVFVCVCVFFFFFKQKTAYEIRNCDWSSDVCSSDLLQARFLIVSNLALAFSLNEILALARTYLGCLSSACGM